MLVKVALCDPECTQNQRLLACPGFLLVSCIISSLQFSGFYPVQSFLSACYGITLQTQLKILEGKERKVVESVPGILITMKADTVNLRFT